MLKFLNVNVSYFRQDVHIRAAHITADRAPSHSVKRKINRIHSELTASGRRDRPIGRLSRLWNEVEKSLASRLPSIE
jgi:hypothetical protein